MLPSIANSLSHVVTGIWNENHERNKAKEDLRSEIARVRREREQATKNRVKELLDMRQQQQSIQERMDSIRAQELHVHCYASELKGGNNCNTPSHILFLQAQLCRQVHSMCVLVAQLKLMENLHESLKLLVKEQQRIQLKNLLWTIEAKTELLQQEDDELYQQKNVDSEGDGNGIDNLLKNLSLWKLNNPTSSSPNVSPNISLDWEQVTSDDLKDNDEESISFDICYWTTKRQWSRFTSRCQQLQKKWSRPKRNKTNEELGLKRARGIVTNHK